MNRADCVVKQLFREQSFQVFPQFAQVLVSAMLAGL